MKNTTTKVLGTNYPAPNESASAQDKNLNGLSKNILIWNQLAAMSEPEYRLFSARLTPSVKPCNILGVRMPNIRKLAAQIAKEPSLRSQFLLDLPHVTLEENHLHALILGAEKNFEKCVAATDRFLPFVNNWATCDSLRPKCFCKNLDKLLPHILRWISSDHEYTQRFAIEMLMMFYLDEKFDVSYNELVASVKSEAYYVKMMVAWYFATALAKQWDATVGYVTPERLSDWIYAKTVRKACESYRITEEQKEFLKKSYRERKNGKN